MFAVVEKTGDQQRLKGISTPTWTAFAAASGKAGANPGDVAKKFALMERLNDILAKPDEASRQACWNAVKKEWNAFKLASEGVRS